MAQSLRIQKDSETPLHAQLERQLRFLVATGRYRVGDMLPSTRALARDLGVSFHTVRKVYRSMASAGIVASKPGAGYEVVSLVGDSKAGAREQGAKIVGESIRTLKGLGLDDADIEYLVAEQVELASSSDEFRKIIVGGDYREAAESFAGQLAQAGGFKVESVVMRQLHEHTDAEFVIVDFRNLGAASRASPRADVIGVSARLSSEALESAARMLEHETIVLMTMYEDAIAPLSRELRAATGFSGQIMAAALGSGTRHAPQLAVQADLVLVTPKARRRAQQVVGSGASMVVVHSLIAQDSLRRILDAIPSE